MIRYPSHEFVRRADMSYDVMGQPWVLGCREYMRHAENVRGVIWNFVICRACSCGRVRASRKP